MNRHHLSVFSCATPGRRFRYFLRATFPLTHRPALKRPPKSFESLNLRYEKLAEERCVSALLPMIWYRDTWGAHAKLGSHCFVHTWQVFCACVKIRYLFLSRLCVWVCWRLQLTKRDPHLSEPQQNHHGCCRYTFLPSPSDTLKNRICCSTARGTETPSSSSRNPRCSRSASTARLTTSRRKRWQS